MTIKELCKKSHKMAVKKGFWDKKRNDGEIIALMHSELSEVLEGLRKGNPPSGKIPKFTSVEEEIADLFIRAGDYIEAKKLRIVEAIVAKMKYNSIRPYKHGKEF